MRFFRVQLFNDGLDVCNVDVNISERIICEGGGGEGNGTVIFEYFAVTGEKSVKANGLILEI